MDDTFWPRQPFWTFGRVTAGLLVAGCAVIGYLLAGSEVAVRLVAWCILPLAVVWWPDATGGWDRGVIAMGPTRRSPPGLVRFFGWVALLVPVFYLTVLAMGRR